jgi:hypothetical protein
LLARTVIELVTVTASCSTRSVGTSFGATVNGALISTEPFSTLSNSSVSSAISSDEPVPSPLKFTPRRTIAFDFIPPSERDALSASAAHIDATASPLRILTRVSEPA